MCSWAGRGAGRSYAPLKNAEVDGALVFMDGKKKRREIFKRCVDLSIGYQHSNIAPDTLTPLPTVRIAHGGKVPKNSNNRKPSLLMFQKSNALTVQWKKEKWSARVGVTREELDTALDTGKPVQRPSWGKRPALAIEVTRIVDVQ